MKKYIIPSILLVVAIVGWFVVTALMDSSENIRNAARSESFVNRVAYNRARTPQEKKLAQRAYTLSFLAGIKSGENADVLWHKDLLENVNKLSKISEEEATEIMQNASMRDWATATITEKNRKEMSNKQILALLGYQYRNKDEKKNLLHAAGKTIEESATARNDWNDLRKEYNISNELDAEKALNQIAEKEFNIGPSWSTSSKGRMIKALQRYIKNHNLKLSSEDIETIIPLAIEEYTYSRNVGRLARHLNRRFETKKDIEKGQKEE